MISPFQIHLANRTQICELARLQPFSAMALFYGCAMFHICSLLNCRVLRKAAETSSGLLKPPLVAHVLVVLSQDRSLILEKGHQLLSFMQISLSMLKCSLMQV